MENDNKHNSDIDRLLEKLYSPSDAERELAKKQLIALGSDAVAPLIAFLRDLAATNQIPRFLIGQDNKDRQPWRIITYFYKEKDMNLPIGAPAWREYLTSQLMTGSVAM